MTVLFGVALCGGCTSAVYSLIQFRRVPSQNSDHKRGNGRISIRPDTSGQSERDQRLHPICRRAKRIDVGIGQGTREADLRQRLRSGSRTFHPRSEYGDSRRAAGAARVRVRREFPASAPFTNAQYSFSVDSKNMIETVVLRLREQKDLMQISIEDSASSVASPAAMLSTNTPVSRIKLERFGKPSVVLARCSGAEGPATDQTAYEPLFQTASSIMNRYRDGLGVRRMVPQELVRLRW